MADKDNKNLTQDQETTLHDAPKTAEEREQMMQKFMQENLKKIMVTDLDATQRAKIEEAVQALSALRDEILEKRSGALEKKNIIRDKVAFLQASGKVNINDDEFKKSDKSVDEFVTLLDKMISEVERDIAFFNSLLDDKNRPEHILAFNFESDDFADHVANRVSGVKKYVKSAKRDLAVSYSRYCFGFDAQIRQISYVEYVLKHMKKDDSAE